MPRPRKPKWPDFKRQREYGTGSLSRDQKTGEIRARLPKRVSPTRQSRLFATDHEAEAHAWLDSQLAWPREVGGGSGDTLRDWAGHWHRTFVQPLRPHTTARWQLYALTRLKPLYNTPVVDLRPSDLQAILNKMAATLAPETIKAVAAVWRRCLAAAVHERLIDHNPAEHLVVPRREKPRPTERRHITSDEVDLLWPAIHGHRFEAAYALLVGCGLRLGEILGLAWEHVHFDERRAWIERQFTDGDWRPLPKGRNPHWVSLPTPVIAALRRHRSRQPESCTLVMQSLYTGRHPRHRRGDGPRPWSRTSVVDDFHALLTRLGIDHATPHASRHGLASWWLDNGVPAAVVAQRLGHAHAGTTLKFYARPTETGQELADELVARRLPEVVAGAVSGGESGTLSSELST